MKVAVIGAGVAGLCAARHLSKENISFLVYEQNENIGGTWVYSDNTTEDEYGLPIHSSMYKNLRTNLPKEIMQFIGHEYHCEKSFITWTDVLTYLQSYADRYDLHKYIKFRHQVTQVSPLNNTWSLEVKNLKSGVIEKTHFDAIMVCNGSYSTPRYPAIPGMDDFQNTQMHSHQYRTNESFKNKKVVIVGSGPSGIDIAIDIASVAQEVYLSHHQKELLNSKFPENVKHKTDIALIKKDSVEFQDGSVERVDVILYCTGYIYHFPFLSNDCGITVDDNYVQPLYKHLFNINHPTMCFIGIPWKTLIFLLFELQVLSFISVIKGKTKLLSKSEMFDDLRNDIEIRKSNGEATRYYHRMGTTNMRSYIGNLTCIFKIDPLPEVIFKIYDKTTERRKESLLYYREDFYKIIDDYNFSFYNNQSVIGSDVDSNS
ncbi:flavin-containing monooxygenase FMO GS-OX5 isoform X2 [Nilaparvata lugens]|nr:flavin-containing monooxygenase FMO GS-OX5 isoform X2 [Nilaparvata lugens]XP_022193190.2 flavin-containing monooxygenase FMO GS-OX5 isoform X2 [Nilaparvata lugens]